MPGVYRTTDPYAPIAVLTSWIWGLACVAAVLTASAVGQAVGAWAGGCDWIGISIPVHRPVWALVDQPTLDFARRTVALGYWFGGVVTVGAIGALAIPLLPRPRTVAAEQATVQLAWTALVIGVAWMPLLDLEDGHPGRWFRLHTLPVELLALAPVAAAGLAVLPTVRLLAIARAGRPQLRRVARVGVVVVHLVIPVAAVLGLACVVAPHLPAVGLIAAAAPIVAAVAVAWIGFPAAFAWPLERPESAAVVRAIVALAVGAAVIWVAGRPVGDGHATGLLWSTPTARNNIRPWIEPVAVAGASVRPVPYPLDAAPGAASARPGGRVTE
jgi:hypothetical protein